MTEEHAPGQPPAWTSLPYPPQQPLGSPPSTPRRRSGKTWLWITLAIVVVLAVVCAGLGLVGLVLYQRAKVNDSGSASESAAAVRELTEASVALFNTPAARYSGTYRSSKLGVPNARHDWVFAEDSTMQKIRAWAKAEVGAEEFAKIRWSVQKPDTQFAGCP